MPFPRLQFLAVFLLSACILTGCGSGSRSGSGGGGGVNQVPTMDAIGPQATNAGQGAQMITLTGVSIGIGDVGQTLTITATSNNQAMVDNPSISGTGTTRTLTYTPLTAGTATITVVVMDDGGTANGGVDTLTLTFDIVVGAAFAANLVINEIDYDTTGADTQGQEFIEIYNGTGADVPLADIELYFVNGASGANYANYTGGLIPLVLSLAGPILPAGAYLVAADNPTTLGLVAGANLLLIDLGGLGGQIQNGNTAGDGDGLILYNTTTNAVLDSVGYSGALVVAADIDGQMNVFTIGEAAPAPTDPGFELDDSIGRDATGTDTDNNSADFRYYLVATPGAAN